jgi:hypothetical protein
VRGTIHLRAAIIAARATNSDLAADHLTAARSLAVNGQVEANFYGTKLSLPNVSIHEVSMPLELTDGTTAVARAADVTLPANTAPSRIGHYWTDLARAWLLHGDRRRAWTRCSKPGGSLPNSPVTTPKSVRPCTPGPPRMPDPPAASRTSPPGATSDSD